MEYLKIKNWGSFQQYKDREPKWIKIYRSILMDYKFEQLTDAEFGALVKIWLLASQLDNKIPNDPSFIQRKCGLSLKPNIKKYLQLNFLQLDKTVQDCTETYTEKRREEKRREDKKEKFTPPLIDEVIKYFQDNGYPKELATHVYKYYAEADPPWTDSKGNKVRGWKQKMRGVWFKSENKQKRGVDIQPKTYAQAQDAERRQRAAWLRGEIENDNQESGNQGNNKAITLLPGD